MRRLSVATCVVAVVVLAPAHPSMSESPAVLALTMLEQGNARFAADALLAAETGAMRRRELAAGQHPFATVLSCADSRVPPEYIFNVGLGDLFVIRVAGEVTDHSVLASAEYASEHLSVPLIVVLGHSSCGAVEAAMSDRGESHGPNLDYLLKAIKPAVERTRRQHDLTSAVLANVDDMIDSLLVQSPAIRERVEHGMLGIVGGFYELSSGQVHFSPLIDSGNVKPHLTAH